MSDTEFYEDLDDWFSVSKQGLPQQYEDDIGKLEYLICVVDSGGVRHYDIATLIGQEWKPRTYQGKVTHWNTIAEPTSD
jgi:hypothetical protein